MASGATKLKFRKKKEEQRQKQFSLSSSKVYDNDNDTLREVPHWSDEGLALQARVSGPWPHKKESVLQVKLALLARCKNKLLWTECSAQR